MIEPLMAAIYKRFMGDDGAATREILTGGLWPLQMTQGVASANSWPPHAVYIPLAGTKADTMSSYIDEHLVQFSIFVPEEGDANESGFKKCLQARDLLVQCYDDVLLTLEPDEDMPTCRVIMARRQDAGAVVKDPDGGWSASVTYNYMVSVG